MYKILAALLLLSMTTLGFADQPEIDTTAQALEQQSGDIAWSRVGPYVVSSDNSQAQRVTAIFNKLEKVEDFGKLQLLVADLTATDEPVMVVGETRVIVQLSFAATHSDDAMAFTLGHELGHLRMHHMRERVKAYLRSIDGPMPDAVTLMHASMTTPAFVALARQQELQADAFGKSLASRAGFDAMAGARETLDGSSADSTHPPGKERIAALQ
jgi:Zn-dependent protease with chaperone function